MSQARLCIFLFASVVWAQPGDADRIFAHALQLHQSGDLEGAVREYRSVLAANPRRVDAQSNLGAALAKLGRYQEAIEQYQQALQAAPPPAAAHLRLNLALAYYKSFQIPRAATELAALHADDPENLNATLLLADCDLRMGEFQRVIDLLLPLEAAHPDERALAYMLGMALIRAGQVAQGQQRVDRILRAGDSPESRMLLATSMLMAKDYPAAVRGFARAIELNPNMPSLQSFYGQSLLATGDADAAAQAFRKELAVDPNDYESNLRLGEILAHRRQFKEALPFLERAATLRPGSEEATQALAGARAGKDPIAAESGGVATGALAPDFSLPLRGAHGRVTLSEFRGRKPVILVFGSYTCPKFRSDAGALNALHEKYGDRAAFVLVYIREAHSADQWQSTINQRQSIEMMPARDVAEKNEHASVCIRKLNIKFPAVVDGMDGKVETAYEAWPSRVYLIARDGRVAFNSRLGELDFRAEQLEAALRNALAK